jgi:hypothetical protein
MSFPHRNTHFSNTSIFLTAMDLFIATLILYMAIAGMTGITQGIWRLFVHIYHHWWVIFQLPVYWVGLVVWLLFLIMACIFISLAATVYYQMWGSVKDLFASEEEVY